MAKFIVKGRVKYNGQLYVSGQVVEVEQKDVEEFKAHGWEIVKHGKPTKQQGEGEGQGQKEDKDKLTKDSKKELIIAELVKRGIEHDTAKTKAELFALLA